MAAGKWSRWGQGDCEGSPLSLGDFITFLPVCKDGQFGKASRYEATSPTRKIDEFPSAEIDKAAIEDGLESGMRKVLHDWEIYQPNKFKRRKA